MNVIETFQIHDQKIDYSNVKSRAGANDNVGHKAGGGTTKVSNTMNRMLNQ